MLLLIAGKMIMIIIYEVKQRGHFFFHRLLRRCLRSLTTKQQHQQHHNHKQHDTSTRQSILFLSPTSWPEPNATAAGTRTMSLLQHFSPSCPSLPSSTSSSLFHSVHFGCGANLPRSYGKGNNVYDDIQWHRVKPNRSDDMVKLIQKIETENGPVKAVVFDRFYAEEAYSFRIREECPNALRVLDMQDVHSLRVGRQFLVDRHDKSNIESSVDGKYSLMTPQLMDTVMKFDPSMSMLLPWKNENNKEKQKRLKIHDTFLRELASVHRSDLVLVCSSEEMEMLEQKWQIPRWKLVPASFFCSEPKSLDAGTPSFDERTDFVTVGGFKHPPNVDSINILHKLWPQIRVRLPAAKMHVYGAYPSEKVLSLHDEKNGFLVHGHVEDLDGILKKSRVLLAPLRFGAGIKGKIVDAWRCGCPVITTPVGAEGMRDISHAGVASGSETSWGGRIVKDEADFVSNAVSMYYDKALWYECQEQARSLLNTLFDRNKNLTVVDHAINYALINMDDKRRSNLVGSLLWHQNFRSTEYFSKWIELKEFNKEKHL